MRPFKGLWGGPRGGDSIVIRLCDSCREPCYALVVKERGVPASWSCMKCSGIEVRSKYSKQCACGEFIPTHDKTCATCEYAKPYNEFLYRPRVADRLPSEIFGDRAPWWPLH